MSIKTLATAINREGLLQVDGLRIQVKVTDVRQVFGRIDYEVTPTQGSGSQWVESSRVTLDQTGEPETF